MTRSVGIDLGAYSTKVLGLETAGKGYRIYHFSDTPIPQSTDEATLSELLASTFKNARLPRDMAVLGLDAHSSVIREITVPFRSKDQIRKIIKYESESHLFSFGIDDVIIDFVQVKENADSSDLIVIAVVKEVLREKLSNVEDARIDPIAADIDLLAHFNSLSITPYPKEHAAFALLDIGFRSMKLMVVEDGKPVQLRGMRGGYSSIIAAIARETNLTLPAAEAKIRTRLPEIAGSVPPDLEGAEEMVLVDDDESFPEPSDIDRDHEELESELLVQRMAAFRQRVVREVNRSLARVPTKSPVELLLITGGGSTIPAIDETIAAGTGIDVKPFDILDFVKHPFDDEERASVEPFISAPLGLALKPIGGDASGTQFRREEFAYQKRFEAIKTPLTLCLTLLMVFLGIVWYIFRWQYELRRDEYDRINYRVAQAAGSDLRLPDFQKYLQPDRPDAEGKPRVRVSKIGKDPLRRHRTLQTKLQSARMNADRDMGKIDDSDVHHCALDTWNEVFRCVHEAQRITGSNLSPIIPSITFDQQGAVCNMILRDPRERDTLIKVLETSELLKFDSQRTAKAYDKMPNEPRATLYSQFRFAFRSGEGAVTTMQIPKDPWRLLVAILAVANVAALVAVILMVQQRNAASAALKDAQNRVDHKRKATIFKQIKRLGEVHALRQRSGLASTKPTDVERYLRNAAANAQLAIRELRTSDSAGRKLGTQRIRDYKFTMTFQVDQNIGVDRKRLASFLWLIKTRTPQIKITSIESGGSSDDWTKADKWDPRIEFVLSKEEEATAQP